MGVNFLSYGFDYCIIISYFFQTKRSLIERSFCFCRHLCTVLSPATPYCSNGTRAVICRRQNNPVNCFVVAIQWGNGSCRQHIQSHRFELLIPRSHPFVTPWHFPCQGNLCLRRHDWVTIIKPGWKSLNCQGLLCFLWAIFRLSFSQTFLRLTGLEPMTILYTMFILDWYSMYLVYRSFFML